jgi:hypothetical protein
VRVRRGSEGFEVRPIMRGVPTPDSQSDEDGSWEEGRISEGELDGDGDRMRRGPRYRVYDPGEDDASESSGSDDSMDSMDDYLEENAVV